MVQSCLIQELARASKSMNRSVQKLDMEIDKPSGQKGSGATCDIPLLTKVRSRIGEYVGTAVNR